MTAWGWFIDSLLQPCRLLHPYHIAWAFPSLAVWARDWDINISQGKTGVIESASSIQGQGGSGDNRGERDGEPAVRPIGDGRDVRCVF